MVKSPPRLTLLLGTVVWFVAQMLGLLSPIRANSAASLVTFAPAPGEWHFISPPLRWDTPATYPPVPGDGNMALKIFQLDDHGGDIEATITRSLAVCAQGGAEVIRFKWSFPTPIVRFHPGDVFPVNVDIEPGDTLYCQYAAAFRTTLSVRYSDFGGVGYVPPDLVAQFWPYSTYAPIPVPAGARYSYTPSFDDQRHGQAFLKFSDNTPGPTEAQRGYFGFVLSTNATRGGGETVAFVYPYQFQDVVLSASPTSLRFNALKAGAAGSISSMTPAQPVTVSFKGGSSTWTASANQPWVQIANGSGTGAGIFTASIVNPNNVLAGSTSLSATITVSAPGASNTSVAVPVTLTIDQANVTSTPPFGQMDTPLQNAAGVVGAIGVTGWTLDNVGVASLKIYRSCLAFDPAAACQTIGGIKVVFIGDAAFLAGARPDVEQAFATFPQASRAGWGFLLLTNMLPHVPNSLAYGGQGPLALYVFATDVEGNVTLLGRSPGDHTPTAITMANDTIAKPFGAIDTPGQGATVSGTLSNFGWVLTPDSNTTPDNTDVVMPLDGSTMNVFIDGVPVGKVSYNNCRGTVGNPVPPGAFCNDDIANIFGNATPQPTFTTRTTNPTKYRNLDVGRGAIAAFSIDTTPLTNGLHSIAWGVSDSAGRVEGIGSRNFIVLNSGADVLNGAGADRRAIEALAAAPAIVRGSASSLASLAQATRTVSGRTGFDLATALTPLPVNADGVRQIGMPELERVELALGAGTNQGYLVANGTLRELPAGSHLDPSTGVFTWAPGPGYIGTYRLTFVRGVEQLPVDVTIRPAGTADISQGEVRMVIDAPDANTVVSGSLRVAGWALDPQAAIGSGIDAIHVWAVPAGTTDPSRAQFLGTALLGSGRPDVAAAFGSQFSAAGYTFTTPAPAPGEYDLIVYAHSAQTGRWEDARTVRIAVK